MKKILTSFFILACCMGGSYGDSICSIDQCKASDTVCKNCSDGNEKTVGSVCNGNYVITATDYLMPHWEGPSSSDGDSTIEYCYCYKDSIHAKCDAGYYGVSVFCQRTDKTETWTPGCDFCQTSCTKCPADSTSSVGATSVTDCKCPADSYMNKDDSGTYTCLKCPENSSTNSATGKTQVTQCTCTEGFYMNDSNKCAEINGGNYTDHGNTFSCDEGYYKNNDKNGCERCPAIEELERDANGNVVDKQNTSDFTESNKGATSIQECYIPKTKGFCDEKGCGTYSGDAYHK